MYNKQALSLSVSLDLCITQHIQRDGGECGGVDWRLDKDGAHEWRTMRIVLRRMEVEQRQSVTVYLCMREILMGLMAFLCFFF